MSAAATGLDHVGLCVTDPRPIWEAYEGLGFTLSPEARQSGRRTPDSPVEPYGTGNRCALFREGYVEILGILDPGLFDNGVKRFVARYEGAHIIALAVADEQAALARLRRAGIDIPGVSHLERPVDAPDGPRARFARLPVPEAPEGRLQLIRHLTPELVWQDRWLEHANRAVALDSVTLVAAEPAESAARLSRLAGVALEPDPAGGFVLPLPGDPAAPVGGPKRPTRIRILPPDALGAVFPGVAVPALPFIAGFVIRTDDGNAAARRLLGHLPLRAAPEGLMVPPELAGGAALVFAE
ncbi:VOC family protein [Plastoroseomonas hellenica]|uniref:VOC family protein n=1 Tax=Plastoroseomonas hellenica TaxID=2687306 RepID=UPI001BAD537B|nr:VOC family protein [Plastoroseomonas hellenica]MBR0644775.1 VOC family protein [Plastoroseomonas hellenica]